MSQCTSSNLLIEIEELGSGPPKDDVTLGDDIYIANEGLVDKCEDTPGLIGDNMLFNVLKSCILHAYLDYINCLCMLSS